MRAFRLVVILVATLVVVVAVLVAALLTTDLGRFKPLVESLASDLLVRDLKVDGPLSIRVGREIHVVADAVRITNPDWAQEDDFIRAGKLDVTLQTLPLLSEQYFIEDLSLDGVEISLEQNEAGENTWALFGAEDADDEATVELGEDSAEPLELQIRQARIRDLALAYSDAEREAPLVFTAPRIDEQLLESGDVQIALDGDLNGTAVSLDATAGKFADLLAAGPARVELRAIIGEISISGNAGVDSLDAPRNANARLEIDGPNAQYLTDVLSIPPVTQGPLNLLVSVTPEADRTDLNIQGQFGEFELDVTGATADLQDLSDATVTFSASGPDAAVFGDLAGLEHIPPDPFSLRGAVRRDGERLDVEDVAIAIGETDFNLSATIADLSSIDGSVVNLQLKGPEFGRFNKLLGLPGQLTGPFSLDAALGQSPSGEELVDVTATARDIRASITGVVSTAADFIGTELSLTATGGDLSIITAALDIADGPGVPFDVQAGVLRNELGFTVTEGIAKLGDDEIRVDGLVGAEPLEADTDISFSVKGADLGKTLTVLEFDADQIPDGPYEASGRIYREGDGFVLESIKAALGKAEAYQAAIDGRVSDADDFIGSELVVSASGRNLREAAAIAEIDGLPAASFQVAAKVERREAGFAISDGKARLADDRLSIDGLVGNEPLERDTDLRFEVSGPDLTRTAAMAGLDAATLPSGSYEASGRISRRAGYFDLQQISARLGETRAKLAGRLGNIEDFEGTDIDLTITGKSLAALAPADGDLYLADLPFDVSADVGIKNSVLGVRDLKVRIGSGELSSNISVGMSPMLASGSVEIEASGPAVSEWLPRSADFLPADAPFDLNAALNWQDTLVSVDRLLLKLAKGRVEVKGTADVMNNLAQTDLTVDAQVASMSNLGVIAGTLLPDEPLDFSAHLLGADKVIRLEDLRLLAGRSDISGNAAYEIRAEKPRFAVNISSQLLDLRPFIADDEAADEGAASESADVQQSDDSRVIPDTPIPVDMLNQLDARLDVSVGELVLRRARIEDLLVKGLLQDGQLRVERFELSGERGGTLAGKVDVLPVADGADVNLVLDGDYVAVGFTPTSPDAVDQLPSYDIQVKLAGRGATIRDVAATLDGTVRMLGGSGKVKGIPALNLIMGDMFFEVVDTVNPFTRKQGYTQIQCFAVLLRSVDGRVDGVPAVVLQTDKLNIISTAYVDLGTEAIDVRFEVAPRKGLGIGMTDLVTPYTKISGTMAKPNLAFDAEEAVKRGTVTAATLGTSWLAKKVKGRFFSPKDPCGVAAGKADEEMRQAGGN
jgi:uncharacterized protein involved in outer membrane biogenesis